MIVLKPDKALVTGIMQEINGTIEVPGDKSISHRAIMLGSLAAGISKIDNLSFSRDNLATVSAFRKLGVAINSVKSDEKNKTKKIVINGVGIHGLKEPKTIINTANSGTLTRLIAGILAGNEFFSVLSGDKYLNSRPMKRIIEPLNLMGAKITGRENGNYPPIAVNGAKLKSIYYEMPVPSAQVKSCIMLAALFAEGNTIIYEKKATRDHTENFLKLQGYPITVENTNSAGNIIAITGGGELNPFEITVPGDFSSAAFFIALGLLHKNSEIIIKNVLLNEKRTGLLRVLKMMGANMEITVKDEKLEKVGTIKAKYSNLKGVAVPLELVSDMIDEFPIFAVIASFAEGTTFVSGAGELRVKESDRIKTIVSNLSLFGIKIKELEDGFEIEGNPNLIFSRDGVKLNSKVLAVTDSFGDHRIAMSMIIMGLLLKNRETEVRNISCINTSFPEFFDTVFGLIK